MANISIINIQLPSFEMTICEMHALFLSFCWQVLYDGILLLFLTVFELTYKCKMHLTH